MTAAAPERLDYLPDILEGHLEELQGLLPLRDACIRARDVRHHHVVETDARILAHLDGVFAVGERAYPLLATLLGAEDPVAVETAAFCLAASPDPAAHATLASAWDAATDVQLPAIGAALRRVANNTVLSHVVGSLDGASQLRRALAARALVRHGSWRPGIDDVSPMLGDTDPAARREGWLLVRDAELVVDPRGYAAALRDDDPGVRNEALLAAAWTRVLGALNVARQRAQAPSKDDDFPLRLLAAIGDRKDAAAITALSGLVELGALRFELAGLYGLPALVPDLLAAMAGDDMRSAIAAGQAMSRITGVDFDTTERVSFPREGADPNDEFEREFEDEGLRPDVAKAHETWSRLAPALAHADRVCHGRDVGAPSRWPAPDETDQETRWWHLVRARFRGVSDLAIAELERFPAR